VRESIKEEELDEVLMLHMLHMYRDNILNTYMYIHTHTSRKRNE